MIKHRSFTAIPDKPRRKLLRKNSKVKHYQSMLEEQNILHDEVVKLTMVAIGTNKVSSMTPFISDSTSRLEQVIYTEPAEHDVRRVNISSFQSFQTSEMVSRQSEPKGDRQGRSVFDRLLKIINFESPGSVKRRKAKQIVKTEEDVLSSKYLAESREATVEHKKFKNSIIDKMNKTGRANKSLFSLTSYSMYDIVRENTPLIRKPPCSKTKRETRTTHFYSQTKKKLVSEREIEEETKYSPIKHESKEFTYIDFLKSRKKNRFLNEHRKTVNYCADLAKNEEAILSMVKYGSKDYDSMKKCVDLGLER